MTSIASMSCEYLKSISRFRFVQANISLQSSLETPFYSVKHEHCVHADYTQKTQEN